MAEGIRGLADFGFNPLETAMKFQQMDLQRQQIDQGKRGIKLRETNQLADNVRADAAAQFKQAQDEKQLQLNALKDGYDKLPQGPAQLAALNQFLKLGGIPHQVSPNEYYADARAYQNFMTSQLDSPEERAAATDMVPALYEKRIEEKRKQAAVHGAQKIGAKAGLPDDPEVGALVASSGALQGQVGNALIDTPDEIARRQERDMNIRAKEAKIAQHSVEGSMLLDPVVQTRSIVNEAAPFMPVLDTLNAIRDPQERGQRERLAIAQNPDIKKFQDALPQLVEKTDQELSAMKLQRDQLEIALKRQEFGGGMDKGESMQTLTGKLNATNQLIELTQRKKQFYLAPDSTSFKVLQEAQQGVQAHMDGLGRDIQTTQQERLDIQQQGLALRQSKDARENTYNDNVAKAQQELAKAGNQNLAGKIAAKYDVKVTDITGALKDPNRPTTMISLKEEGAEAAKVGEAFGKEYANLQTSAVSAGGKLAKLDRMEQLMEGMQTGKLSPAITQIQAVAAAFGLQLDSSLPAKQALESLTNEMTLELRNPSGGAGMPGAMSDKDREFLTAMPAGLSKTPEGNKLIIETARAVAKREQEVAKLARAYRKKNGHFDEGFFDELQEYSDAHPLFKDKKLPAGADKPGWSITPVVK